MGSSPLSRGILEAFVLQPAFLGIIPALAGNTSSPPSRKPPTGDHPRSRGEYSVNTTHANPTAGSSPLSRGILSQGLLMSLEERIIPALAGNTQPPWWSSWFHPDHPRSRGEYVIFFSFSSTFFGSSPLSRGIRVAGVAARGRVGIIPALAGNTPASRSSWSVAPDHPRSRGEYPLRFGNTDIVVGSSPLSRGIHFRWWTTSRRSRIIPALAGNTLAPCRTALRVKDHPRSRGEYASEMSAMPRRSGSSPLSRGIQSWCRTGSGSVRIIPALAGNTHGAC